MKHDNPDIQAYVSSLNFQDRIDLNDAFYGGRCEPIRTYCDVKEGETIQYSDIVSLYPFIQQYSTFGIGHPDILLKPNISIDKIQDYFGIIKALVLAPGTLHLPVLPMKMNNKLIFALCRTCAHTSCTDPCTHTTEERQWVTTCHTNEIHLAIQKGYRILDIFEVWSYPPERRCKYSKEGGDVSIFGSYMTLFTRVKMESSGYPDTVVTDTQKDEFIESIRQREGVTLVKGNIKYNAGMRFIAKSFLNSIWGKLCQRSDRNTTKMYGKKDLGPLMRVLSNPAYQLTDFHIAETAVIVTYKPKSEYVSDCDHSNVLLAATVTSAARCHLYSFMDAIPNQCLYNDTDSVIWLSKEGLPTIEHGSCLGQMKSELPSGASIRTLAACGAKSYAYILTTGQSVCRVKGFSLNHRNSQIINFESMKHMLRNNPNGYLECVDKSKIRRDKKHCILYSNKEVKKFTVTNNKRVYFPDFTSKPYGYTE